MIISHSNKFVFVRSQKTASTTMQHFLLQYCNKKDFIYLTRYIDNYSKYNINIVKCGAETDHASVDYIIENFKNVKDYKFITTIRHPEEIEYSRLKYHGFDDNLNNEHLTKRIKDYLSNERYNQLKYIFNKNGENKIDFFIKVENFNEDCKKLCEYFGWEYKPIDKLNKSKKIEIKMKHKDYELVYNKYKQIYELFGYDLKNESIK